MALPCYDGQDASCQDSYDRFSVESQGMYTSIRSLGVYSAAAARNPGWHGKGDHTMESEVFGKSMGCLVRVCLTLPNGEKDFQANAHQVRSFLHRQVATKCTRSKEARSNGTKNCASMATDGSEIDDERLD